MKINPLARLALDVVILERKVKRLESLITAILTINTEDLEWGEKVKEKLEVKGGKKRR